MALSGAQLEGGEHVSARLSFLSAFPLMVVDSQGSCHHSQLLCCFLCLPPVVPLNCAHVPPIISKKLFLTWFTSLISHCSAPQTLCWHSLQEWTGEKQEGRREALAATTKAALLELQPRSLLYFLHTSLQTSQVKGICLWYLRPQSFGGVFLCCMLH